MGALNTVISIFITGMFTLCWLVLLILPLDGMYFLNLLKVVWADSSKNTISFSSAFTLFLPCVYLLGTIMNSLSGRVLKPLKDVLDEVTKIASCCEKNEHPKAQMDMFLVYLSGAELYNYFNYHREIIRVLRGGCINFLLISIVLVCHGALYLHPHQYFWPLWSALSISIASFTAYIVKSRSYGKQLIDARKALALMKNTSIKQNWTPS